MKRAIPILCLPLLLAACASASEEYPSLAIREAERVRGTIDTPPQVDAEPPAPPRPVPPALLEQVAQYRAQAVEAHAAFLDAAGSARRAVAAARGAGIAGYSWSSAAVAVADLQSRRSRTAEAVTDLELVAVQVELEQLPNVEVGAAYQDVLALLAEEDALVAELNGALRR